eukprot:TRINITY_DN905_c1_g1_i3.p1 TRINITY_DN905_c1_g1~~TRINITY_DN905_c1_g1_i3.p1  ORF type:complete len:111 (-),score=11.71 TRINITY_DN905_c1_g1_i3:67-399(-)
MNRKFVTPPFKTRLPIHGVGSTVYGGGDLEYPAGFGPGAAIVTVCLGLSLLQITELSDEREGPIATWTIRAGALLRGNVAAPPRWSGRLHGASSEKVITPLTVRQKCFLY